MAALLPAGISHTCTCRNSAFYGRQLVQTALPQVACRTRVITQAAKIGPLKDWEHYPLTSNGKVKRVSMPMKKGDTVKVISGSHKGKVGEVISVLTKVGQIVISDVNVKTRIKRPSSQDEKCELFDKESPIHHSNAMLYSTKSKVASRIGHRVNADGKKVRYLKKNGEELP